MTCHFNISDERVQEVVAASAMVKLCCGVANNAAWMVALEAFDHVKKHRNYRHRVKRLYKKAFEEFHKYERRLVYARENRLFHVGDLSEANRKRFGNISDREYYEFWQSTGDVAYQRTHPLVTSLWNKYRLSLLHHGVSQPEILAWPMVGHACLVIASSICESAIESSVRDTWITKKGAMELFGQLSLKAVAQAWNEALQATDPQVDTYELDSTEEKNIVMGLEQLRESWVNADMLYGCTRESADTYDEVFRTKGEQKKAMRELQELQELTKSED